MQLKKKVRNTENNRVGKSLKTRKVKRFAGKCN